MVTMQDAETATLCAVDQALAPVRGLISTENARSRPFALTDLKKWFRLNAVIFKVEKVDIRPGGATIGLLPELLAAARQEGLRASLRVAPPLSPALLDLAPPRELLDVFLCASGRDTDWFKTWIAAAVRASIPVRAQVEVPLAASEVGILEETFANACAVNIAASEPFSQACLSPRDDGAEQIDLLNSLARRLSGRGVETHLIGLPFCLVQEDNLSCAVNSQQFHLDHPHYQRRSYEMALQMHALGPAWMGKAVENRLARATSVHNALDQRLFPWILEHPKVYARVWMLHKLTRHLKRLRRAERALPEEMTAAQAEIERLRRKALRDLAPACRACRYRRICDHETESFRARFPRLRARTIPGDPIVSPLQYLHGRARHYDAVDAARLQLPEHPNALAAAACAITLREPHTREIAADSYDIEGRFTHHMPGAIRWCSFAPGEMRSTPLTRIEPPFTMTLTFGGGIAEHIGFAFGRHAKIMCPMIDYTHRLTLHVDALGHYVLLRDNVLVRPTEFEGERRLPQRLAGCLEPRVVVNNVDGFIVTQTLLLWERGPDAAADRNRIRYSVIIINTRYARRLQAALLALAHQRDFDMSRVEIVVGYVPGIDTTDDLIDSLRLSHPGLRIVRAPFSPDNVRSKGFMINECARIASGAWIVLLDADIIVPPDFFAEIDRHADRTHFIAPDGRKMLSPETTARVLLGQVRPWECFDELAAAAPEYRFREAVRIPIGFCQCVRREVIENVPYHELDHFEGSDWMFGKAVVVHFGPETRLEGKVVLHLDHAGSQWYGAPKQL